MHYDTGNERELLLQIADGDEAAFAALFYHYGPKLHAYLTGFTKSDTLAEELVQNTFMRVWLSRDKLPELTHLSAWIYRVAANEGYNFLKRKTIETRVMTELGNTGEPRAADQVSYNELRKAVAEAVASLPEKRRKIYQLSRESGMKPAEIARVLNISVSTVKNTLAEAQKNIRDFLTIRDLWVLAVLFLHV